MRDNPDTRDLIRTARNALKSDVLPHVGRDQAYPVRMAINALGIALRQIESGAEFRAAARDALAPFCDADSLDAIAAELARRLRAADPLLTQSADLHAALRSVAVLETQESAPRARALRSDSDPL